MTDIGNADMYAVEWAAETDMDVNAVESVVSVCLVECVSHRNICYKSCVILKNGSQSHSKKVIRDFVLTQALIGSKSPKNGDRVDIWWAAQNKWYSGIVVERLEDHIYLIYYDHDETRREDFTVTMWRLSGEQMIYTDLSYAFAQCIQNCYDKMHGLKIFPQVQCEYTFAWR